MRFLSLLFLFISICFCEEISYDIHIKLPKEGEERIKEISRQITALCPHNKIDFDKTIPHITLYLTVYDDGNLKDMVSAYALLHYFFF